MMVGRAGEDLVELTLQPDLLRKERKEERVDRKEERVDRKEERVERKEVTVKKEETVEKKEETVDRKEERMDRKVERALDWKARVDEAKITLVEVNSKMRRAIAAKEWGVLESLKNQFNPAWKVLLQAEPECGWEDKWYAMNVDASLYLGQAMMALRRFGVVEQVVGRPGEQGRRVQVPNPGDPGWSHERVARWFVLRASTRIEERNLGGAEYDLEEAERLARRAMDRWGRGIMVEVERMWKVVMGRRGRR